MPNGGAHRKFFLSSEALIPAVNSRPVHLPNEQISELCFDTGELAEPVEILGFPVARLEVSADRPLALVAVRLCDVWPDGVSTLITVGFLNLAHRNSSEHPEELTPGQRYAVEVKMNSIGYSLPAGHRLRLAVSPTYWPWIWPSLESVVLSVYTDVSHLELPTWAGDTTAHEPPPHFFEPEEAPSPPHQIEAFEAENRETCRDVATGRVETDHVGREVRLKLLDDGLEYQSGMRDFHRIFEGEPLSAFNLCERDIVIARDNWRTRVHTVSTMSSTAKVFHLTNVLEGYEGDCRIFAKTWELAVPRDNV